MSSLDRLFHSFRAILHEMIPAAARCVACIERQRSRKALAVLLASMALLVSGQGFRSVDAKPLAGHAHAKIAHDLDGEINENRAPKEKWARDVNGVRHVQVVIVSDSPDAEMTELRAQVLRLGGSVHAVHPAVHAITVQIKSSHVQSLSQRDDVISISPNRETQRTFSTLESITGALTSSVRTYSSKTSYSGLDGSGIGIAILDSGVMRGHDALNNGLGRVKRNVNMRNASLANWATGTSSTTSLQPGSSALRPTRLRSPRTR